MDVRESQVSREESNEYFGITLERAARILNAVRIQLKTRVEIDASPPAIVSP